MNRIFCFWTGTNEMSENRLRGLASLRDRSGCEVTLISEANLSDLVPAERLHPAYRHLNLAHRADYLRCYAMRHEGGGYADIKPNHHDWTPHFDRLATTPDLWAIGYREHTPGSVSNMYTSSKDLGLSAPRRAGAYLHRKWLQANHKRLIGCCAFICKRDTPFVEEWWREMNRRLDRLLPALERNPARAPYERPGDIVDGVPSRYPVPWTHVLGDIFHPLGLKYTRRMSRDLPPPDSHNYR
ncbi:hypothetical protein [Stappia sp. ES.058]|uniref:hypothetical protein n=1 Tax=Stappia sp. ES.058 TaxID=1881061 RepID=UPI00087D94C0|nr:hypothetical protein [Stappia sp. ES.058]SDU38369.1 hypothetical protein SAMN05428979_3372 [Stappia sp. ES.058]